MNGTENQKTAQDKQNPVPSLSVTEAHPKDRKSFYAGFGNPDGPFTSEKKEAARPATRDGQNALALIGEPPQGSHPDEWFPRAETWHLERQNWEAEVEQLRRTVAGQHDRIILLMTLMDDDEKRLLSEHDGNQAAPPVTQTPSTEGANKQ